MKKDKIIVKETIVTAHKIEVLYEFTGGLATYFDNGQKIFWLEYSEDVSKVPLSIAVIPFVCNILPIVWITDSVLLIQELDESFFESIEEFKKGYIDMYPMFSFRGKIDVGHLIRNDYHCDGGNIAFFSGGLDAFTTLICHINEKPILITLRGSDIKLDDLEGWDRVYKHLLTTVADFNLPNPICISSNFRTFINEDTLSKLVISSNDGWWHGFQCGIGLIAQAAPMAFVKRSKIVYIASSYTLMDKIPSASYPTIDNHIRFGNSKVVHDQYEHHRQEKVQILVNFKKTTNNHLNLRVCWISRGGMNCCHCEKCLRTIFALIAEGENPKEYGFNYTNEDLENSKKIVTESLLSCNDGVRHDWIHVKERFIETGAYKHDKRINWVYKLNPYAGPSRPNIIIRLFRKMRRVLSTNSSKL